MTALDALFAQIQDTIKRYNAAAHAARTPASEYRVYLERLFELCNRPGVMNHPGWPEFSQQIKKVLG
jgi:hypothetical protein